MNSTLCIDVGGTGIKAALVSPKGELLSERIKISTPYPCPPERLLETFKEIAATFDSFHQVTVGFPGLVRNGVVSHVPALSRATYGGKTDKNLQNQWRGFSLETASREIFSVPTLVANDADVQGAAVVTGQGFEFVMTLGTGVGTALFNDGHLLPHLELSHARFRNRESFDIQLGNAARKQIGNARWSKRVLKAIEVFDSFLYFDQIHIGGGNAEFLRDLELPKKARIVSNVAGLLGGVRLWNLESK
ncbi:MAG: ROK family protein [Candidatus Nanopelagicales bacterium]